MTTWFNNPNIFPAHQAYNISSRMGSLPTRECELLSAVMTAVGEGRYMASMFISKKDQELYGNLLIQGGYQYGMTPMVDKDQDQLLLNINWDTIQNPDEPQPLVG